MPAYGYESIGNFTGGLNLRPDQLQLAEGEFPYCRNVDIDARGGVAARPSWRFVGTAGSRAVAQAWTMYPFTTATYRQVITCSNPPVPYTVDSPSYGAIYYHTVGGTSSVTVTTQTSLASLDSARVSGGVSCAQFGNTLYLARGKALNGYTWSGAAATSLTSNATGAWQDSFATPTGTHMPDAEHVATHGGYLWVAATDEDGTAYLNRVRFSHPGFPQSWRQVDYIDVVDGGPTIRALVSFGDMLLVFKDEAVYAILGYDVDTFQLVKMASIGVLTDRHVAQSESSVYFYSWSGKGIYRMERDGSIALISEQLNPIFDAGQNLSSWRASRASLAFCGKKLRFSSNIQATTLETYVANPFGSATVNSVDYHNSCVLTFDPAIEAWTLHTGCSADGIGFSAAVDLRSSQGVAAPIACIAYPSSSTPTWLSWFVALEGTSYAGDQYLSAGRSYDEAGVAGGAVADSTATYYPIPTIRTPWIEAGNAALRKRWLRPQLATREITGSSTTTVYSFRDFDETTAVRTATVTATGSNDTGAAILKSGPIGTAKAVQLMVELPTLRRSALLSIVLKYAQRGIR